MGAAQTRHKLATSRTRVPAAEWHARPGVPVFDSDRDGWTPAAFRAAVVGRSSLLFVNMPVRGQPFGCFVPRPVLRPGAFLRARGSFLFAADSSRNELRVYRSKTAPPSFCVAADCTPDALFWMADLQVGRHGRVAAGADKTFRRFVSRERIVPCDRKLRFELSRVLVFQLA